MNYYPKIEYWRPLVPNSKSVDKTSNPHFKCPCAQSVAENEADFVLVLKINMLQYPCVHNSFQKYEEVCELNIKTYYIRETGCGGGFTH